MLWKSAIEQANTVEARRERQRALWPTLQARAQAWWDALDPKPVVPVCVQKLDVRSPEFKYFGTVAGINEVEITEPATYYNIYATLAASGWLTIGIHECHPVKAATSQEQIEDVFSWDALTGEASHTITLDRCFHRLEFAMAVLEIQPPAVEPAPPAPAPGVHVDVFEVQLEPAPEPASESAPEPVSMDDLSALASRLPPEMVETLVPEPEPVAEAPIIEAPPKPKPPLPPWVQRFTTLAPPAPVVEAVPEPGLLSDIELPAEPSILTGEDRAAVAEVIGEPLMAEMGGDSAIVERHGDTITIRDPDQKPIGDMQWSIVENDGVALDAPIEPPAPIEPKKPTTSGNRKHSKVGKGRGGRRG